MDTQQLSITTATNVGEPSPTMAAIINPEPTGLFVYGTLMPSKSTLMQSFFQSIPLLESSISEAILDNHKLYNIGHFPGATPASRSEHCAIRGEFVDMSDLTESQRATIIWELDRYEGCPGLYTRQIVTVWGPPTDPNSSGLIQSYVYIINPEIVNDDKKGLCKYATTETYFGTRKVFQWR